MNRLASTVIVLIGGGGLGPWVWDRVVPTLEREGFDVHTPELRGTGGDLTAPADISLDDWVEDVVSYLAIENLAEVTLVVHSFAGYLAAGVLARVKERIANAVFLDALIPEPGRSWFDVMGGEAESFMRAIALDGATPWFSRQQLDQFYPEHGLSEADLVWMLPLVTDQPIGTYAQPASAASLTESNAVLHYVRCVKTAPPVANANGLGGEWIVSTLDAGHWPMLTTPEAAAHLIANLARGV